MVTWQLLSQFTITNNLSFTLRLVGIGITPALGAINAFKNTRRVNLIWAVRDPGKSALVLFYDMNSCVQYEASMTWILQLNLVCL